VTVGFGNDLVDKPHDGGVLLIRRPDGPVSPPFANPVIGLFGKHGK
jgi:hypothetical protein